MTLQDLKDKVHSLAARAGLTEAHLPTFGSSADGGRPHVEVDGPLYHYVTCERGRELERLTFGREDELLFHLLERATAHAAGDWELTHRVDNHVDSRRDMFRKQRELMSQISPEWAERVLRGHEEVLRQHPFDDAAVQRVERFKELQRTGLAADRAWAQACTEFPQVGPA